MCNYYLMEPLCGHRKLLAGPSCYALYDQLQRINDPVERARPGIPFEVPPGCLPHRWNVRRMMTGDYCSFECMNNGVGGWGVYGGEYGTEQGVGGALSGGGFGISPGRGYCGERGASFGPGSERIGVGWRC